MKTLACALALTALAVGPVRAQTPAPATLAVRGTPDVQVVVGPGQGGWQVALVFPRAVEKADARRRLDAVAKALGQPARSVAIETHRLEREAPQKVGEAPAMTSATFLTSAELVDYNDGRLAIEPILIGLQDASRVNVTFLVPGRFAYRGPQRSADNRVAVEFAGGEGAYTFVTNIVSRPLDGLNLTSLSNVGLTAARSEAAPRARMARFAGFFLVPFALVFGLGTYLLVRRAGSR